LPYCVYFDLKKKKKKKEKEKKKEEKGFNERMESKLLEAGTPRKKREKSFVEVKKRNERKKTSASRNYSILFVIRAITNFYRAFFYSFSLCLSLSLSLSLSSILWGLSFDNNDNLLRLLTVPIYTH